MFDLSWAEMALLVVVALIFIGPKDLPVAMKALSKGIRAMRGLAAEFQRHLDEMVQQADLGETHQQLRDLQKFNLRNQVERIIDPDRSLRDGLDLKKATGQGAGSAAPKSEPLPEGLPRAPAPPPPPPPSLSSPRVAPTAAAFSGVPEGAQEDLQGGRTPGTLHAPQQAAPLGEGTGQASTRPHDQNPGEGGEVSEAQLIALAPAILPPRTARRLVREAASWQRPSVLPPEVALHNGIRVVIMSETRTPPASHPAEPETATLKEAPHG
ncbi:Sec-independent protein translocase protein TatB [Oecophyllibacter saccharovorans]|uniref:Sec-independent protein translocase protein TatB n=1 Tax=Oecophyllibacter saccharovorans TaxID=2558360 RepID=A0A506UMJ3_9PROT|nr:Sec-independent protein translocase protein TatB [Oecophyllibacter saccharovorans]TPW34462.1 twin-arginine translocase subunit TatB [Oecophyllibacter saccharovorans]